MLRRSETETPRSKSSHTSKSVWFLSGAIALIAVFLSALLVVDQARERQSLYTRLNEMQDEREKALGEYSRLLIERWTLSSHSRVHRIAETDLDLTFPEHDQIVEILPSEKGDQGTVEATVSGHMDSERSEIRLAGIASGDQIKQ